MKSINNAIESVDFYLELIRLFSSSPHKKSSICKKQIELPLVAYLFQQLQNAFLCSGLSVSLRAKKTEVFYSKFLLIDLQPIVIKIVGSFSNYKII